MSQTDSFIDEVTEEVRRERLYRLARRYGWIVALAIVLAVGGAAWNEWRKARAEAAAQRLGDAILEGVESTTPESRALRLSEIAADGTPAGLIALLRAAELAQTDPAAAAETLEALGSAADLPPIFRDIAALKRTMIPGAPLYSGDRIAALAPLTAPGAPLRLLALEQIALLHLERGENDAARDRLTVVLTDAETSVAQRQRVQELLIVLGGLPEGT